MCCIFGLKKKRLIISIDFCLKKAYMMWLPSCFIRLVVNIYFETSAIIRVRGSVILRPFKVKKGVKQGSALSPRLFGLFINDIVEFLAKKWAPTVRLGNINFSVLLFAYDIALVANSANLQKLLDLTDDYLKMKCLQVKCSEIKSDCI